MVTPIFDLLLHERTFVLWDHRSLWLFIYEQQCVALWITVFLFRMIKGSEVQVFLVPWKSLSVDTILKSFPLLKLGWVVKCLMIAIEKMVLMAKKELNLGVQQWNLLTLETRMFTPLDYWFDFIVFSSLEQKFQREGVPSGSSPLICGRPHESTRHSSRWMLVSLPTIIKILGCSLEI